MDTTFSEKVTNSRRVNKKLAFFEAGDLTQLRLNLCKNTHTTQFLTSQFLIKFPNLETANCKDLHRFQCELNTHTHTHTVRHLFWSYFI